MKDARHTAALPFLKMHGAGNHFVVIDSRGRSPVATASLAQALGHPQTGVGFDQLAEIRDGEDTDISLDFWNADGSRAGACGNATRCVAHHVMAGTGAAGLTIRTARGVLVAERLGDGRVNVNMGQPLLDWTEIPLSRPADTLHLPLERDPVGVGMGNPHAVHFVHDAGAVDLARLGPRVEHDPLFPERTNVEFASITGPDHLRMRVWERGTGITMACGSGACATAVAAHRRRLTGRKVTIDVDGGTLQADWREDGVWLTGPVAYVFEGVLSPEFLAQHA
jgi:diaminopimelate epimerase